ncbi:MAG: hypothetical protein IJW77_14065 [Clostridia bacterium]|nr:hypothetical protein [Clostridia bacterium]
MEKYVRPFYVFSKHQIDFTKHEWIPENRIQGKISSGQQVVFSVQGEPSSYHGFLSFNVNWYFCCYDGMDENHISGFSIAGSTIDCFYSPWVALEQKHEFDEKLGSNKMVVSSSKNQAATCGEYMLTDAIKATMEVDAYTAAGLGDYEHPIFANSRFITEFSEPVTIDTTIKAFEYALRFFLYVTYRANVDVRKSDLFVINDKGTHEYWGILVFPQSELREHNKEAKHHLIVYNDLKEKTAQIFTAIKNEHISLQHICSNYDATHSYPISRVIMVLSAFERVYGNIYGKDTDRSDEYIEIKAKVVDFIEQLRIENTGKRKKAAKTLKDYVFNRDASFSSNTAYALNDCADVMKPFVKKRFKGDYDDVVDEISERIGVVRNGVAHCKLDFKLEAVHLIDIIIMEELLYAMQLKHIGLTTYECHKAIGRLFRENIHFNDDEESSSKCNQ